jgi:hypothetical protein
MTFGIVFTIVVAVGIVLGLARVRRRGNALQPLREAILSEPELFRCSVPVKYKTAISWSTKTVAGMVLVVSRSGVALVHESPRVGRFMGGEWFARPSEATANIESLQRLPGKPEDWLVFRSSSSTTNREIAVYPQTELDPLVTALREAHVAVTT